MSNATDSGEGSQLPAVQGAAEAGQMIPADGHRVMGTAEDFMDEFVKANLSLKSFVRQNRYICIVMFVDLSDSTEFKVKHSEHDGLLKMYTHHSIVRYAMNQCGGKIVKYIGDEVMCIFIGRQLGPNEDISNVEENLKHDEQTQQLSERALKSVGIIKNSILKINQTQSSADYKISNKIVIRTGIAYFLDFKNEHKNDPHGTLVDSTARMMGMCHKNQVLVCSITHSLFESNPLIQEYGITFSNEYKRRAKGIHQHLTVRSLGFDDQTSPIPNQSNAFSGSSDFESQRLEEGRVEESKNNFGAATAIYESIKRANPLSFPSMLRIARLANRQIDPNKEIVETSNVASALDVFPGSPEALSYQHYLEVIKELQSPSVQNLENLINRSEKLLQLTCDNHNLSAEIVTRNLICYMWSEIAKQKGQLSESELLVADRHRDVLQHLVYDFSTTVIAGALESIARYMRYRHADNKDSLEQALKVAQSSIKRFDEGGDFSLVMKNYAIITEAEINLRIAQLRVAPKGGK
jgi:class 3 adenylate cyclase